LLQSIDIEKSDDAARKARELVESFNESYFSTSLDLIERYVRGYFQIGFRVPTRETPHYGFVVSALRPFKKFDGKDISTARHDGLGAGDDREQPSMLACDVEAMEGPQPRIPSLIRFQAFNDATFAIGKPLYEFGPFISPGEKGDFAFSNGKIHITMPRYGEAVIEAGRQNIQTASDCADINTGFDRERERKRLFLDNYYELFLRCRIRMNRLYADVSFKPGVDARIEGWELGYGPVNGGLGV